MTFIKKLLVLLICCITVLPLIYLILEALWVDDYSNSKLADLIDL